MMDAFLRSFNNKDDHDDRHEDSVFCDSLHNNNKNNKCIGIGRQKGRTSWQLWSISVFLLVLTKNQLKQSHAWTTSRGTSFGSTQTMHHYGAHQPLLVTTTDGDTADDVDQPVVERKQKALTYDERYPGFVRYQGRVAYDGAYFSGFQIQLGPRDANTRTIQGTLEETLQKRFSRLVRVVGAGRTDSGVGARGQAFHFDLTTAEHEKLQAYKHGKPPPALDYTMNRMLTDEIRVWNVREAHPITVVINNETRQFAWNAILSSTSKLYSYRVCVGPVMDPLYRFQRWHVPSDGKPVNTTLLAQSLKHFEGSHDFRPFAGAVEQAEKKAQKIISTVRTIYSCRVVDESERYQREGYYRIDILLSGALYKMVRNIVGTAIDVSRGNVEESTLVRLLQNGETSSVDDTETDGGGDGDTASSPQQQPQPQRLARKDNKSKPAPPEGLTLERVYYGDDDDF